MALRPILGIMLRSDIAESCYWDLVSYAASTRQFRQTRAVKYIKVDYKI